MKSKKLAILTATAACSIWSMGAFAQTFNYSAGDLLLGFRYFSPHAPSDLIVNIGSASTYVNASGPITISDIYFNNSQLSAAGLSLNNLYFSALGDSATTPGLLWVTKARSDIGTQSSPWTANNFFAQGTTASRIDGIGGGGLDYGLSISAGPANTPSAIAIPYTFNFAGDTSYTLGIGDNGNFNGAFQGNIENTTPGSFTSGSTPVISDLYELDPADAGSAGTYLGYFQLDPNGTLTFNPVPEPTTWAMFGMGLITLAAVRKFRRKNQISNL